ncbi:uncharacterized protein A1O5_06411 [Cladophialophora psammophila CBS 110553]|uniref:N-acetyltransferase domain-containing protein n=1 Tax=Cladophialophora psammophila CBS 110553 TaxID=1182543 RepID=W9WR22_9EURO|nr:uncharacterized protein A1O5_06411 [Cladophialophora psammophila CBS 110553]EXJ70343.1 hypothetical protein A1O5_06411 [Cladophialophora psammophila CBS 110553]
MTSSPSQSLTTITIKPITSETDIPICARLADAALKPDAFHEFRSRYMEKNVYDNTIEKLTEALRDDRGRFFVFKAVASPVPREDPTIDLEDTASTETEGEQLETIVGFTLWTKGYVEVPKMDPFASKTRTAAGPPLETSITPAPTSEGVSTGIAVGVPRDHAIARGDGAPSPAGKPKPFYANPDAELSRKLGNAYVGTIRGKRHLYLHWLVVHPSYQRQGIGQKLLNWGIEVADGENIVAWLFARPAGSRLYERNGWKAVLIIEVDVPDEDLMVAPVVAMLRLPAQQRG